MPVVIGQANYPENILENIDLEVDSFNALHTGLEKAVNIVMLGRLSKYFDFKESQWLDSIKACVKPKFVDMNIEAFKLGRSV